MRSTGSAFSTASSPQPHAVVQVEVDEGCDRIQLPRKPWPRYVRLWRETEPEAVALVVGTLATWGRESTHWSVEALEREFPGGVPGGFAALDQGKLIGPSCCCGLETWQEWLDILTTHRTPWIGHDPAPFSGSACMQRDTRTVWQVSFASDSSFARSRNKADGFTSSPAHARHHFCGFGSAISPSPTKSASDTIRPIQSRRCSAARLGRPPRTG